MLLELVLLTALILGLYLYFTRNFKYWESRGVPCKKPVIFFGNFLDVALGNDHAGKHIERLYNQFQSPYFGFYALNKPYLVLKDPTIIKRIMIQDFNIFPNRFFYCDGTIDPMMGYSLLGIKTPDWKNLRAKLSPMFTTGKIKMMFPLMDKCAKDLVEYLVTIVDDKIEAKEIMAQYTTNVIGICAFGLDINTFADENCEFMEASRRLSGDSFSRYIQALSYSFGHPFIKLFKFRFIERKAADFLRKVFLNTIQQRELLNDKRSDLIDILIELKNQKLEKDDFILNGDKLVAQAVVFFSAGHETSSSTIAFTLHELAINQSIQKRLRQEIEEVVERYGQVTYEAIQEMTYLHMVVFETLRKYPLTPFIQRECTQDYKIPETGLVIECGTPIVIPQHGLHLDGKYFEDPQTYDPERFSSGNKDKIVPFVYLPFGDGPRSCIGERFALLTSKLGIISIITNFKIVPNEDTITPLEFCRSDLLQAKGGIRVTFQKLQK